MPHSLNNNQSLKKAREKSEAQHFGLAEGCWIFTGISHEGYQSQKFLLQGTKSGPR